MGMECFLGLTVQDRVQAWRVREAEYTKAKMKVSESEVDVEWIILWS